MKQGRYQRPYKGDVVQTEDRLIASAHIAGFNYTFCNKAVDMVTLGSEKWLTRILKATRFYQYEELADVIGTSREPIMPNFLKRCSSKRTKRWLRNRKDRWIGDRYAWAQTQSRLAPNFSGKISRAITRFQDCPLQFCFWVTINVTPQFDRRDVVTGFQNDGDRLVNHFNRVNPLGKFLLIPEFDMKLAGKISRNLYPDSRWRDELSDNRLVYKNHFHCIVYAPGYTAEGLEEAFERTASGRRTKHYSGKNQVRVKPIKRDPDAMDPNDERPDVVGCISYSLKCHYRPTNQFRMLETFPEWLWTMDKVHGSHGLIRVGGINRPVLDECNRCRELHPIEEECDCKEYDFYGNSCDVRSSDTSCDTDCESFVPLSIRGSVPFNSKPTIINCLLKYPQKHWPHSTQKMKTVFLIVANTLVSMTTSILSFLLHPIRGP